MGVAMGIDIQASTRASDDLPTPSSPPPPSPPTASSSRPKPEPTPAPAPAEEDVEMTEEEAEESKLKKDAEDAKKMGSEAYKKRNFDEAAALFQKAWDTWSKDVSYLTNLGGKTAFHIPHQYLNMYLLSAVYFEQGEYDKVIETCEKAVDEGRSVRHPPLFVISMAESPIRSVQITN